MLGIIEDVRNINVKTIQRNLKTLIETGIIERTGATKKREWIIK